MPVAVPRVEAHVNRGFEAVREVFLENFHRRGELGGAVCVITSARRSSTFGAASATSTDFGEFRFPL
jgi:hypothetical protein